MSRPVLVRTAMLSIAALASAGGAWLYYRLVTPDALVGLDWARAVLFLLTGFWLVWGGTTGMLGAFAPMKRPLRERHDRGALLALCAAFVVFVLVWVKAVGDTGLKTLGWFSALGLPF